LQQVDHVRQQVQRVEAHLQVEGRLVGEDEHLEEREHALQAHKHLVPPLLQQEAAAGEEHLPHDVEPHPDGRLAQSLPVLFEEKHHASVAPRVRAARDRAVRLAAVGHGLRVLPDRSFALLLRAFRLGGRVVLRARRQLLAALLRTRRFHQERPRLVLVREVAGAPVVRQVDHLLLALHMQRHHLVPRMAVPLRKIGFREAGEAPHRDDGPATREHFGEHHGAAFGR